MSDNYPKSESPLDALKNESARQRWELFHRAIAHAKASNNAALQEMDDNNGEAEGSGPLLSVIR